MKAGIRNFRIGLSGVQLLLFMAGGVVGLIQLFQLIEFGPGFEMVAIGGNLAQNGTFANPFHLANTGPTAVEPPLYPLYLALLIKLWKQLSLVTLVASLSNICANALVAGWLPRISLLFYGDALPGIVGGVLWLFSVRLMPSWDASYTAAGLVLFCVFSARWAKSNERTALAGAISGLFAGFLFLLNNSSMLASLPWIGFLLARRTRPLKRAAVAYICAVVAVFWAVALVWIFRNDRELGAPVLRTNLGMTLYVSNNDCAQSSLIENERQGCYQTHHPNEGMNEAQLLRNLGEVAYDRKRTADAANWIHTHPFRFLQLTLQRFRDFWFPPADKHGFSAHVIWLITALSGPGLILMARNRQPVTPFAGAVLLIYPLMYYLVVSDVRYRYPVLWVSVLSAGYSVRSFTWLTKSHMARSVMLASKIKRRIPR
jgi:hypothetical protein